MDRSVSTHFIHALAPRILQMLYNEESINVQSKSQLEFILECVRVIQILVNIVDSSEKSKLNTLII